MLRIVMDSAGDMPGEWKEEYDIDIIPINIHAGEETYLQGVDLNEDDYYSLVDRTGVIPKTSQPNPNQFEKFYHRIAKSGDTILSIHVTGKLSGTMASAEMAARELEGEFNVIPFDSTAGSTSMGFMCREARELDRSGASLEEIIKRMEFIRRNICITATLDTLDYARMSGRVGKLQAALASMLNIKPIIDLEDGILDVVSKVRTRKRSIETVLEMVSNRYRDRLVNAAVFHARDEVSGQSLLEQVGKALNCNELVLTPLSISLAANFGPGTVGITAYPLEEG